MKQLFIKKISLSFLFLLFGGQAFFCNITYANNASYITLSNQIARKTQLDMIANNVANSNTVGFEQDNLLFRAIDVKQNTRRNNSFAFAEATYRNGGSGAIKVTNRPTDLAIGGEGYFKVATPRGARYTLDGSMVINNQGVLVNMNGFPYLSADGAFIEIAEDFQTIEVASNGAIFVDDEEISIIGVFGFDTRDPIIKEGGNLYAIQGGDILLEEFTIISGALKSSNVNPTLAMAQMVEMQRSFGLTTDVMTNINETENSAINKLTK